MSKSVFFKLIVPNYNNISYIKKCLDSIVQQTFQDFICIVVDDISTDMSDKFVEYYERRYPGKIKFIRQTEKKYAGGARNAGLLYDKYDAQYIWFIDSDDYISGDVVLQKMHDAIVKENYPDILRIGAVWNMNSGLSNRDAISDLEKICKFSFIAPWWSCVNAKFANILFQEKQPIFNDVMWFIKLIDNVDKNKIAKLDEPCYVYNRISTTGCHNSLANDVKTAAKKSLEAALLAYKPKTQIAQDLIDKQLKDICGRTINPIKLQTSNDANTKTQTKNDVKEKVDCFFKIIVPNYNNMSYIKKCLDSILNQTFQDFKIIVVDDLSTDMSDKFCEAYARKYPDKIVYIQLKKKGYAGACRNAGLIYPIKSEYIWFVDSDDWLYNKDALKIMHNKIMLTHPDVLRCPYVNYYSSSKTKTEKLKTDIDSIIKNGAAPYKNCIKSKFQTCKFKEMRSKCNDVIWFLRLYDQVDLKNVITLTQPVYVYNRGSTNSCQNNVLRKINLTNIQSELKLIDDLAEEKFTTKHCIEAQKRISNNIQQLYKTINDYEYVKNSFVISINDNQYKQFCTIFEHAKLWIPTLKNGSTKKEFSGPRNCTESHISLIKFAKENKLPYIFIFEDDAYPCIDLAKNIAGYLQCIPKNANVVLFGWSNVYKEKQSFSNPYNKITSILFGSHAYVIFQEGYDEILDLYNKNPDGHYDKDILCRVSNSYVCHKPLFIQYSKTTSMNKHQGYILYGDHELPPEDFQDIQTLLNSK